MFVKHYEKVVTQGAVLRRSVVAAPQSGEGDADLRWMVAVHMLVDIDVGEVDVAARLT